MEKWPDETRDLFLPRILHAPDKNVRGAIWTALGRLHSQFGRLLPTQNLDGIEPYLDPLQPVSSEHIEAVARKTGILPEDIDAQIAALSSYLGWDIRMGAQATVHASTLAT